MFMNVLLPEPEGPMTATNSPGAIVDRNPVERPDLHLAHLVDPDEVPDPNDRHPTQNLRPPPAPGAAGPPMPGGRPADASTFAVARPTTTFSPLFSSPPVTWV